MLTLNGVSSRLVKQSSNLFRLQDNPAWQVQQLTTTVAAHPDQFKVYWSVTTPDGTRYRFGGEIEPETGADQNSVFFAGIGNTYLHLRLALEPGSRREHQRQRRQLLLCRGAQQLQE